MEHGGGLPCAGVFADFLEPLFHHALRLRGVYGPECFCESQAFDVVVWQCVATLVVNHVKSVVDGCRKSLQDGNLRQVNVCFLDEDQRLMDQLSVSLSEKLPREINEQNALSYHNWFRETLLNLDGRLSRLAPAASFRIELQTKGRMADPKHEWLFADGREQLSVSEPVCEEQRKGVHASVFVRRPE
jgi:hypothetical protein